MCRYCVVNMIMSKTDGKWFLKWIGKLGELFRNFCGHNRNSTHTRDTTEFPESFFIYYIGKNEAPYIKSWSTQHSIHKDVNTEENVRFIAKIFKRINKIQTAYT